MTSSQPGPLDQVAGRYLVSTPIAGGLASRYSAFDIVDHQEVELTVVRWPDVSAIPRPFVDQRVKEVLDLQSRSIVPLLDAGIDPDRGAVFFASRPVAVATMADFGVPRPWSFFFEAVGAGVIEAMAYAHGRGVQHGALDLAHLVKGAGGSVKVSGFGVAEVVALRMSAADIDGDSEVPTFGDDLRSFAVIAVRLMLGDPDHAVEHSDLDRCDCPDEIRSVLGRAFTTPEDIVNAEVLAQEIAQAHRSAETFDERRDPVVFNPRGRAVAQVEECQDGEYSSGPQIIQEDLKGTVHITRKHAPPAEGGGVLRNELNLYGERFSYHAIVTDDHVDLVNARPLDDESDLRRGRAWLCNRPFTMLSHHDKTSARSALADLTRSIDDHFSGRDGERTRQRADLLNEWARQLDAKTKVEERREGPIEYAGVRVDGYNAVFDVLEPPTEDLIGETRVARIVGKRGGRPPKGEILDVTEDSIVVGLDDPDAKLPPDGELVRDVAASMSAIFRQRRALDATRWGNRGIVRPDLGDLILEPAASTYGEPIEPTEWFIDGLDDDKRRAVRRAIASDDFYIVAGPPGTGKTEFIAELTAQTLAMDPAARVLLTSQTHVALDNALERIRELMPELAMTRLGDASRGRISESVQDLLVGTQIGAWRDDVRSRSEGALVDLVKSSGADIESVRAAIRLGSLMELADAIPRLREELAGLETEFASSAAVGADQGRVLTENELKQNRTEQARLRKDLRQRKVEVRRLASLVAGPCGLSPEVLVEMSSEHLSSTRSDFVANVPGWARWRELVELHDAWVQRLTSTREFEAPFLGERQVIAGTCIGVASYRALDRLSFDLCIFDEASKATPTETLVPLVLARQWVLVGDERQLPPFQERALQDSAFLAEVDINLDRDELGRTLFGRLAASLPERNRTELRSQYRMVPAIGNLISECFYSNALSTIERPRPTALREAMPAPVLWLDTSSKEDRHERSAGQSGTSFVNPLEVERSVAWLEELDNGLGVAGCGEQYRVLVMSSYLSQVAAMRRAIEGIQRSLRYLTVEVNTVDAVQGRESDIVLFSVTRSNPEGQWGFMRFDARINVALSRGRFGLVIVGDQAFARASGAGLGRVARYLDDHPEGKR